MALTDYSKRKHPGGYTGIRVTGTLDGEQIQKYFKNTKQGRAAAKALNKRVMSQSDHRRAGIARRHTQQYNYSKSSRYDPPRRTAIVGITMGFQAQTRCDPILHYPVFVVGHQDKDRDVSQFTSRIISKRRDLETTWRECCQLLAGWRGYKQVPIGWYEACPKPSDFHKLRHYYLDQGEDILIDNMVVFG